MKTVLVIEDNAENLRLMTYVLNRAGYQVISAGNGEEGVEMAVQELPFFIIMDIQLPGISGIEAARRIRASKADGTIPIIAVTSFAQKGDREKALAAGCDGYFEKPFDPLNLMAQIHKVIGVAEKEG